MPRSSRKQALEQLTESALRNGGTPKYADVQRVLSGWSYQQVYKLWLRSRPDAPKKKPEPLPPAPPPEPEEHPLGERPKAPDAATCTERDFWEWRVRDLAFDLHSARMVNSWPAVAGLSKQLHEARGTLEQIIKDTEDPLGDSMDDLMVQLEILSRDLPEEAWQALAVLLQEHHGVRILVPRPDGGPSMVLTEDGWAPEGPPVPWTPMMRISPESGG